MINQCSYHLKSGDNTEYPVESAAFLHGIQTGADHNGRPFFPAGKRGIHRTHIINLYSHPELFTTGSKIIPHPHILLRQRQSSYTIIVRTSKISKSLNGIL
ncbi:hypothetical protein D3C81_1574820 [compost metagenome]